MLLIGTNHMLNILKEIHVELKMYDCKKLETQKYDNLKWIMSMAIQEISPPDLRNQTLSSKARSIMGYYETPISWIRTEMQTHPHLILGMHMFNRTRNKYGFLFCTHVSLNMLLEWNLALHLWFLDGWYFVPTKLI